MRPPIVRPAAAADVEDVYRWYERQQVGLGDEFLAAANAVMKSVVAHPLRFPIVHRLTRRAHIRRFPYGLYYRIVEDQIVVVACMHARRDPRRWQSRA